MLDPPKNRRVFHFFYKKQKKIDKLKSLEYTERIVPFNKGEIIWKK